MSSRAWTPSTRPAVKSRFHCSRRVRLGVVYGRSHGAGALTREEEYDPFGADKKVRRLADVGVGARPNGATPGWPELLMATGARWPLGIDIGYSERRASLGLASLVDVFAPFGLAPTSYAAADGRCIFRVETRLVDCLAWAQRLPEAMRRSVLATIDGPITPGGAPREQRYVDGQCQRGHCQYRCPPSSVVGGGRALVDASYKVLAALGSTRTILMSPSVPEAEGALVAEVNPTLGLAWLVRRVDDWRVLPSRNRHKRKLPPVVINGREVRAKSEYYWEAGGNRQVAAALRAPGVATIRHHEAEAALYSLAVAAALLGLAAPEYSTICIGRPDGVFHLLGPIDRTWRDEQTRIGGPGAQP